MPSPAERSATAGLRGWLELLGQGAALALIAWLLVQSLLEREEGAVEAVGLGELAEELPRWSTVLAPERVHVTIDGALDPAHRDWLGALSAVGSRATWNGVGLVPLAATVDPVADPDGGTRVRVAAPEGTMVFLQDDYGVVDSVEAGAFGANFVARTPVRSVSVRAGSLEARSQLQDSLSFGRVLVLGRVGWESGMVASALEERGWKVDARLTLSPRGDVTQGPSAVPDTARYAAVVALDTLATVPPARLVSFVRSGGGIVLSGPASRVQGMAPLSAGNLARRIEAVEPFDREAEEPRRSLALTPISLASDALALESRDASVAVAARRVDNGRVTVVGYGDSWRWRMGGGDDALQAHRDWWSGLVAGVAHRTSTRLATTGVLDEAPVASLVATLGPEVEVPQSAVRASEVPRSWLVAAVAAFLHLPWLSRRLRGAP